MARPIKLYYYVHMLSYHNDIIIHVTYVSLHLESREDSSEGMLYIMTIVN